MRPLPWFSGAEALSGCKRLAIVSNLGRTTDPSSFIVFHPKALEFIRRKDQQARREIGEALRDLQKGLHLGLPLSRPMPDVAAGGSRAANKKQSKRSSSLLFPESGRINIRVPCVSEEDA